MVCVQFLINLHVFFATAKTHKFDTIEGINVKDLKLRPIIDQTGTYIYDASR